MAKGGARIGAGRPKRSVSALNAIAKHKEQLTELGIVIPEEIADMSPIACMQTAYKILAAGGQWKDAAQVAAAVAPYLHPKLSAVFTLNGNQPIEDMTNDDLRRMLYDARNQNQPNLNPPFTKQGGYIEQEKDNDDDERVI